MPLKTLASSACCTPAPWGVNGTAADTALTPSTSITFLTEPPTPKASSKHPEGGEAEQPAGELDAEDLAQVALPVAQDGQPLLDARQKATTRTDRSAKPASVAIASAVITNSAKRGCWAK